MRRVVVAGVVALALLGALLLYHRDGQGADRATTGAGAVAEVANPSAAPSKPGPAGTAVKIHGTIRDERGLYLSEQDGTMQVVVDGSASPVDVTIADGLWDAIVPSGTNLSVRNIVFGTRAAVAVPPTIPYSEWGIDVACRWVVPTLLRVIGEEGQDLYAIRLVEASSPTDDVSPSSWSEEGGISEDAPPVELNGEEGTRTYWVTARGHAWSRVTLSVGFGGERVIRLPRAGTLEVHLAPYDADAGIKLHLDGASSLHADVFWPVDESGEARIEGLPPGHYAMDARVGAADALILATGEVEMEPDATTKVALALHGIPPREEDVPLSGTILVDPAWEENPYDEPGCDVYFDSNEVWSATREGWGLDLDQTEDGVRTWSAGDGAVPPGRYCVHLRDWNWAQVVETGPQGTTGARIVVPPPCDVEVRLIDAATGEPVPAEDKLWWNVKARDVGPEFPSFASDFNQACTRPGIYQFHAPTGVLVAWFWSNLWRGDGDDTAVELKPGLNRIDLPLRPNLHFDLVLTDGAMHVPVDVEYSEAVRAEALTGGGDLEECGDGDPCSIWFTKPGRYRVSFGVAIEGYEPVQPLEVDIEPGKVQRVEVPLKRRER